MDRGFNFMALLQMDNNGNKHKIKPTQFISVAGGVKKRLENNITIRKSTRLTNFDNFRNLPKNDATISLNKVDQRMLQLQKWKEEKEKKKRDLMSQKKKPFIVGVGRIPSKLESPPKPMPSTSGRVTRSQSAQTNLTNKVKLNKNDKKHKINTQSFAPKNAMFNPVLKDLERPRLLKIMENSKCNEVHEGLSHKEIKNIKKVKTKPTQKLDVRNLRSRTKLSEKDIKDKQAQNLKSNDCHNAVSSKSKELYSKDRSPALNKKILTESAQIEERKKQNFNLQSSTSSSSSIEIQNSELLTQPNPSNVMNKQNKKRNSKKPVKISSSKIITSQNDRNISLTTCTDMDIKSPVIKMKSPNKSIQEIKVTDVYNTITPNNKVPRSESSSEEKLRTDKVVNMTPQQIVDEARKISPRVCLSRGKENARKEIRKRIDEGLLDDDICEMNVDHFRRQHNSEIKRMSEMCDAWDKITEQIVLPEEVQEAVLAATGQARLLMSQKMQQFASLLRRCERPDPGAPLVTPLDLQGFWDMVFMQIENVDMRFKKLEQCRDRGWIDEQVQVQRLKPRPKPPVRNARPAPTSRLKDIIAAARKAKKEQQLESIPKAECVENGETKTFEAGFFCVQSPVKSSALATPVSKSSLLKTVLSSEAKKASAKSSSFAMLRASTIGKSVESEDLFEAEYTGALTPVNLGLTPGRSILKTNNNMSTSCTEKKLVKAVLFKSSDSESPESLNKSNNQSEISGVEELINTSFEGAERDNITDEKENRRSSRSSKLNRQEAVEGYSPIRTRSKTNQTPTSEKAPNTKRSSRRKETLRKVVLEENVAEVPNVASRSRRKTMH